MIPVKNNIFIGFDSNGSELKDPTYIHTRHPFSLRGIHRQQSAIHFYPDKTPLLHKKNVSDLINIYIVTVTKVPISRGCFPSQSSFIMINIKCYFTQID